MRIYSKYSALPLLQWIMTVCLLIALSTSVQVTVRPNRYNVLLGGQAEFLCSYQPDVPDCDDTFVFWGRKGADVLANMTYVLDQAKYDIIWRAENNGNQQVCKYTLRIKDVTEADGGQYSCTFIRPQSGRFYIAEAVGKLQPVIPPADIYPICKTSAVAGVVLTKAMALVCESSPGKPSVSLKWWNDGNVLPAELYKISDDLLQLKTIMSETQQLSNPLITCVMELPDPIQEIRSCTVNTTTTVKIIPETVSTNPSQVVTFVCQVTTSIPYEIFWYFQNQLIEVHDPYDQFLVENKAQALHIKDLTQDNNNAIVTCVVATMFGNSSGMASLSVAAKSPNNKTFLGETGTMGLIIGLILVGLLLIVVINIIVCLKCKRPSQPSKTKEAGTPGKTEYTMVPLSPDQAATSDSNYAKPVTVKETKPKVESQYLDMNTPPKKPVTNDTYYAPMKSSKRSSGDEYANMKATNAEGDADGNEYMANSKSDDANTYMYSSTDSLTKLGKATTNAKPVFKPIKLQQDVGNNNKSKINQSRPDQKKQQAGDTHTPAALSDNDTNDYEILSKTVRQSPGRGKLNKMSSETGATGSNVDSYKSSPRLMRNTSAPLLVSDQPEYAVPTDILIHEIVQENSSTKPSLAPVYDLPNDLQQKTNIQKKMNNFEKSTEKSPSAQLRSAMRPPVLHKKPKRHSDPNSSDGDSSPQKSASNRASLPQDTNQYLMPSISQQSLDKIAATTPPAITENKSPILKKVRMPFKTKNNNKDMYQSLHKDSMDKKSSDYQVLTGKVDESQLYENVATGAIV